MENQKIQSFKDLEAWKEAHKLVIMIYKSTKSFPKDEIFWLTSQMRRAAVSITSNLVEGFSRQHVKEKLQFYSVAKGSNTELESQLLIARDIGYLDDKSFISIYNQSDKVGRFVTGLIKFFNQK